MQHVMIAWFRDCCSTREILGTEVDHQKRVLINIVRERTKVIYIISKWSWAGHINRFQDNQWTSRVTAWRPCDKKRWQGRPAKPWRDSLGIYWSDTIWQRTAQDRLTWRRHDEAFTKLYGTLWLPNDDGADDDETWEYMFTFQTANLWLLDCGCLIQRL